MQSQIEKGSFSDPLMVDNYLQVAGLYINCLQDNKLGMVDVCTQIQNFQCRLVADRQHLGPWEIICNVLSSSAKTVA